MIKSNIHSIVDVITNSSTVIFTYQNSTSEAKALVGEVLKLMGSDLGPDDVFFYGIFNEDYDRYFDIMNEVGEDCPQIDYENTKYGTTERTAQTEAQSKWFDDLLLSIMKGEQKKPEWMEECEGEDGDYWEPSSCLHMIPKDEKFQGLADKISNLLSSVSADGGRDG